MKQNSPFWVFWVTAYPAPVGLLKKLSVLLAPLNNQSTILEFWIWSKAICSLEKNVQMV